MSEKIALGGSLIMTEPNTPTREGERIETIAQMADIATPFVGMTVYVVDEDREYVITELKDAQVKGVIVPGGAVKSYAMVARKADVDAEAARAKAAESLLLPKNEAAETYLTYADAEQEHESRLGAESVLQGNINAETKRRMEEDAVLQAAVKAEMQRAQAAETQLQQNINSVQQKQSSDDTAVRKMVTTEERRATEAERALSNRIDNIQPVEYNSTVVNSPDEEDITEEENMLKLKDRPWGDGMGYVILRKSKSLAEQLTEENTIYEVRYDFDLGGSEIIIPQNCVLKFDGGLLRNGIIVTERGNLLNDRQDRLDIIARPVRIFDNVYINGVIKDEFAYVEWFGAKGNGVDDDTDAFRYALKFVNNREMTLKLSQNSIYRITGSINYYDGVYNDIKHVTIQGAFKNVSEYPFSDKITNGIHLDDHVKLFADAQIDNVTLCDAAITGSWVQWHTQGASIFKGCVCHSLIVENCTIMYVYAVFNCSSCWRISAIRNNTILDAYYFAYTDGNEYSFVDSQVYNNYINGGAPTSVEEIDNYFWGIKVVNGSSIHDNFIDYYRVMYYNSSVAHGIINSRNNHYQVFKYCVWGANISSIGDIFNWNDENSDAIKDVMQKYRPYKITFKGEDIEVPSFIASDNFNCKNVVFKNMTLEANIGYVLWLTGVGTSLGNNTFKIMDVVACSNVSNLPERVFRGTADTPESVAELSCYGYNIGTRHIDAAFALSGDDFPAINGAWNILSKEETFLLKGVPYRYTDTKGNKAKYAMFAPVVDPSGGFFYQERYYFSNYSISLQFPMIYVVPAAAEGSNALKLENITLESDYLVNRELTICTTGDMTLYIDNKPYAIKANESFSFIVNKKGVKTILSLPSHQLKGNSDDRPIVDAGETYFDTTLGKPIWWDGAKWVDAIGTEV